MPQYVPQMRFAPQKFLNYNVHEYMYMYNVLNYSCTWKHRKIKNWGIHVHVHVIKPGTLIVLLYLLVTSRLRTGPEWAGQDTERKRAGPNNKQRTGSFSRGRVPAGTGNSPEGPGVGGRGQASPEQWTCCQGRYKPSSSGGVYTATPTIKKYTCK